MAGAHAPSSEYPFHRAVYEARPDLRAVVHAHPVALVAWSIGGRAPDTRITPQTRQVCGEVGFAAYAPPGSTRLGEKIGAAFRRGHDCVVLENHGVVTGGAALQEAFQRFETLEFAAKTLIKAAHIGAVRLLSEERLERAFRRIPVLEAFRSGRPGLRERELRKQLCDFVRRGYRQRLAISTAGSFSARVDEHSFLITPHPFDRYAIEPGDLVMVREGRREADRNPSHAVLLHQAVYARRPEVGAVINAFPVNATAFSICDAALSTRTIPESYLFLRDVEELPFGVEFGDGSELAGRMSPERPVVLFENNGVFVTGRDVLSAFDRLEVLEATAEALINSRSVGGVRPLSREAVAELRRLFPMN